MARKMMRKYDDADPMSIEAYGKGMIGRSFQDIYEEARANGIIQQKLEKDKIGGYAEVHARKAFKGGMGNLVEECYFGYKPNSSPEPDFPLAGVELKVTPYKRLKKGFSAKERLVLTMINYSELVEEESFEQSHLWKKAKLMLLAWYLHIDGRNDIHSEVDYVQLFTPPPDDLEIIRADYRKIVGKVKAGKAHELSEGDTMYLGACTKGAKSTDRRSQPFSGEQAKPRAFSLKNSYMTYVFNKYIRHNKATYSAVLPHGAEVADFEGYVTSKVEAYKGWSMHELCEYFKISKGQRKSKNIGSVLAFRILGVANNHAEEFEKAGIVVKTIRIKADGEIKENMSFPVFRYEELAGEVWENSTFAEILRDTRFFFVVYRSDDDGTLKLCGCQFWNIPYADLEGEVKRVWKSMRDIVRDGKIKLRLSGKKKAKVKNNFPKQKDSPVAHVRPHGKNRADTYPLPAGTRWTAHPEDDFSWLDECCYTKQSFWLNNTYIRSQMDKQFLEN